MKKTQTIKMLTVSDVARKFNIRPRVISDLFYDRELSDKKCPIIGGRRMIPLNYVPELTKVLQELDLI